MNLDQSDSSVVNTCHEYLNHTERNVALLVYGSSGIVSVVTSLTASLLIIIMKLYPQFVYRLALYQELSSIFISLTQCVGLLQLHYGDVQYDRDAACTASALLLQYALWLKLMFTAWLMFHLFFLAVFLKNLQRLELMYVLSSIMVPLLPTCIPLFTNAYGQDGARCWIKEKGADCKIYEEGLIERYVLWFGPAMICLLLTNLAIVIMLLVMRRRAYTEVDPELTPLVRKNKQALKQMLPLVFYPLLFLLLMLIPIISRIVSDISRYDIFPLALLHGIAYPPGGFFSGLVIIIHLCVMHHQRKRKGKRSLKEPKPAAPPPPINHKPSPSSRSKFSFLV